jgi:hypothetical protein
MAIPRARFRRDYGDQVQSEVTDAWLETDGPCNKVIGRTATDAMEGNNDHE